MKYNEKNMLVSFFEQLMFDFAKSLGNSKQSNEAESGTVGSRVLPVEHGKRIILQQNQ